MTRSSTTKPSLSRAGEPRQAGRRRRRFGALATLLIVGTGLAQLVGTGTALAANSPVGSMQAPTGTFTSLFSSKQPYNKTHYGVVMGDLVTQTITNVGTTDPASGVTWASEAPIPVRMNCGPGCTGSNTSAPGVVSAPNGQYIVNGTYSTANGGTITFSYTVPATGQFCSTYPVVFGPSFQNKSSSEPDGDATWTNTGDPFNTSTSTNGCPVDVAHARTAATSNIDGTVVQSGTAVYPVVTSIDDANTQPSSAPTGTVTYTLYKNGTCTPGSGTPPANQVSTQTVTISGGVVPNGTATSSLAAGSYSYLTTYSGDANYGSATLGCEVFTIATPAETVTTHVLNASSTDVTGTTVALGTTVHDTTSLSSSSPTPTGTVTYKFFTHGTCTGTASTSQTVTLSGGSVPAASTQTPAAGSYSYQASYSGDTNYAAATGSCEQFGVGTATPTITNQVKNSSGTNITGSSVALGTTIHDTSSLGSTVSGFTPTGTATYSIFSNGTCNGTAASTQTVTLSSGAIPDTSSQTPGAGSYSYEVSYSGDSNYGAVTSGCSAVTVTSGTLTITTQVQNGSGANITGSAAGLGSATHDTATLVGTAGVTPTGSATYKFFTNGTCSGTASSTESDSLSGGVAPASAAKTLGAGSYSYLTSYSGDSSYAAASASCESFNITAATPSLSTQVQSGSGTNVTGGNVALGTTTNDTATLGSSVSGFTPTGTATYQFFGNGTCTGTASSTQAVNLSNGSVPASSAQTLTAGSYSYLTSYSGDSNYNPVSASCESFTVAQTTPTLTTQVKDASGNNVTSGSVALGTATHDTASFGATIAGFTPTGTVTYKFFANGTCNGTATSSQAVTLSGGAVSNSNAQTLSAGSYSYLASYSGDSNYGAATAGCETFTVGTATPALSTQVQDGSGNNVTSGSVALGTATHDTASLGSTTSGFTPTGTVTYKFFANGTCNGTATSSQAVTLAGGAVPNSSAQTLSAGSYSYLASYSGDSNYGATTAGCESFTVGTSSPSLSTQVQDGSGNNVTSGSVVLGTATYDTASLGSTTRGFTPTGTVTYKFFANGTCNGTASSSQTVTLSGGAVPNSNAQTLSAGSYSYLASYSGDSNYGAATAACEAFSVAQATPSLTTQVQDGSGNNVTSGSVALGTATHDTASIGGAANGFGITGTVIYQFFSNGTCAGSAVSSQTVTISGGSVPNSNPQTLSAGSYSYLASYSGNPNYNATTAGCESFLVAQASPNLSTQVQDGSGNNLTGTNVALGTATHDTSSLSGTVSGFTATGTVTYQFFTNGACTGTASSSQTVTLSGGSVPGAYVQTLPAGSYSYLVGYSGDANYTSAAATCESFTVAQASPNLSTQVQDGSGNNVTSGSTGLGTATHDTSSLTGTVAGFTALGTVTYQFFANGTCTGPASTTQTVTLSGGSAPNASTQTLPAGSYSYLTSYSGDSNYKSATATCESFTVAQASPNLSTQVQDGSGNNLTGGSSNLGTATHDSAVLSGTAGAFTPTGTVTYSFFANGSCVGTAGTSQTVTLSGGSVPNASAQTLLVGSYSYLANYSGDANYASATAPCESFTINPITPTLATQVQDNSGNNVTGSGVALGTPTNDTANLGGTAGVATATGTVTYQFFDNGACSGSSASSQTVTLSGGAAPASSAQTLPTGSYSYLASYSGDSNYNPTTGGCETFSVNQASPSVSTQVQDGSGNNVTGGGVVLGTPTNDTSLLGGAIAGFTPAGTVTYLFFSNGSCTGTATSTQVVALAGGVVPSSSAQSLLVGSYSYLATYSGDANYASASAPCESFTVNQATPSLSTAVLDSNGNNVTGSTVQPGTTTNDTATIGSTVNGVAITGTVTYSFFANGACNGTPVSSQTVTIASGSVPGSSSQTLPTGSYSYLTSYSGDANYAAVTASCEVFARGTAATTVTTLVEDGSGNPVAQGGTVAPGTSTQDTASVASPVNGISITGTLAYAFFSNGTCSGTPTSSQTVTISGGLVPASSLQTLPYGSYSYLASYSGDANYNPSTGSCETFNRGLYAVSLTGQVFDSAGLNVTGPSVYVPLLTVHDTSTVGSSQPSVPITGTVTYTLYVGGTCSGTVVSSQTVTITNGQVPSSAAIIPTLTYGSVTSQTFSYLAYYNGDGNYAATASPCQLFTRWCSDAYWRVYFPQASRLVLTAQPFYVGDEKFSGTQTNVINHMKAVFIASQCTTITTTTAAGCLANWLLIEQIDVLNGSPTTINPTIATAQQFLGSGGTTHSVTYDGTTTTGIVYTGPAATYTLTADQVTVAENLALSLLNYTRTGLPS